MTTLLVTLALAGGIGFLFGYASGSKTDFPVKRTIEQLNETEALRAEIRRLKAGGK